MTNPILELLRADVKKHTVSSIAMVALDAQDPLKQFVRDYAMMRDAADKFAPAMSELIRQCDSGTRANYEKAVDQIAKIAGDFYKAIKTAETYRELFDAVREGM